MDQYVKTCCRNPLAWVRKNCAKLKYFINNIVQFTWIIDNVYGSPFIEGYSESSYLVGVGNSTIDFSAQRTALAASSGIAEADIKVDEVYIEHTAGEDLLHISGIDVNDVVYMSASVPAAQTHSIYVRLIAFSV